MADGNGDWCLIESDPGVFTDLISKLGVGGLQVEEVWDLDGPTLADLEPVYGLVFLFKWEGPAAAEETRPGARYAPDDEPVFFAKQVIQNACATQAILSVLLNSEGLDLGEELTAFKLFTADFPAEIKGLAISNSDVIRGVHNQFARSDPFVNEIVDSSAEKEDAFHFISYVPANGSLYELDGLAPAPVNLGECTQDDWVSKVRPVIQERMARYTAAGEIRFNLMAVIKSRAEVYGARLEERENALERNPSNEAVKYECEALRQRIRVEQEKQERYRKENARRGHNFIPLIYELLTQMAKRGVLPSAIEEGKKATKKFEEAQRARKEARK